MNKITETEWFALFKQQEDSGLTAAAFCRENQIFRKHFSQRKPKLNWQGRSIVRSKFIPVKPQKLAPDTATHIRLSQGATIIELPCTIEPAWRLIQLLRGLQ